MERRLAAILAADVVGYNRLMSNDEKGTLARPSHVRDTRTVAVKNYFPATSRTHGWSGMAQIKTGEETKPSPGPRCAQSRAPAVSRARNRSVSVAM